MNAKEDPEEVPRLLETRGYQCVFRSRSFPLISRYKAPENGLEVDGYVTIEKKPKQQAYSVAFGVTCKTAEHLLEAAEPSLSSSPLLPMHTLATPHVAWFSAGRLLKCTLLNIPDGRTPLPQLLDELVSKILDPYVERPKNCLDVLTILRRNDLPFEWAATFPIRRAVHLAATARGLGLGQQQVIDELLEFRGSLRGDLQKEPVWGNIVTFIVSTLWNSSTLRH